jgi:aminotransferase
MDYERLLCRNIIDIAPSGIRRFFNLAAEMEDCISLGVGEPDFVTPWRIREAGIESLQSGKTWYTANTGMSELLKEISGYMDRRFGLRYAPDSQILVTVGGSEAIDLCMRTLINPGDEVIVPVPSFVCYIPIARMCGAKVVRLETKAEDGFRVTAKDLSDAISPRTKLLVLPYPNNPTGAVMRREHLEELAGVLEGTGVMVLSDELYAELTYGEDHLSAARIGDDMYGRTIVVNGFSKAFAMTGWRLGYACGPAPVISQMLKLHQFAIMCAPTMAQYAAITALRECEGSVESMKEEYNMRRRFVTDAFNRIGLRCLEPEGAFYSFPYIGHTGMTSAQFCERLLMSKRVAVVPGDAFDICGEGHIRVSYSYSVSQLAEGIKRIEEFLKEI